MGDPMRALTCTCGEPSPHVVMRRSSADGTHLLLWCDGAVTGALGYRLPGCAMVRPRSSAGVALALKAGRLMLGEACLWADTDLPALQRAAARAARTDGLPGTVRRLMRASPALRPAWQVLATDRDGRWRERVWVLPRLRWPGTAVFQHRRGGEYQVWYRLTGDPYDRTYRPGGPAFRTLAGLLAFLLEDRCAP